MEGTYDASTNSMVNFEKNFYRIDNTKITLETSIPSWGTETTANTKLYYNNNGNPPANLSYPTGCTPVQTTGSTKLYKLNATTNKTGLEFMIKVMAGDHIDIFGKSYYLNTTNITNANSTALDLLGLMTNFLLSPGNVAAQKGITAAQLNTVNSGLVPSTFFRGNNSEPTTTIPKAYINYIFLDEQFKYAGGGASRVGTSGVVKDHWQTDAQLQNISVPKNGYIFVYVSNESNFDVFFDNLQVIHKLGPILEETHYYPFGLTMAGISDKAAGSLENNKQKFQGQEFAHKEFSDGSGLEMYEFKWRMDDPQTGRFWQIDPLADKYVYNSTYAFSENKVTGDVELEGLESTPLPNFMKAVQDEFIALGKEIDNMFSISKTDEHIVLTEKKSDVVEVRKSVESSNIFKLNFGTGDWMSHVARTNSNYGAPPLNIEINKTTEVSDKTTTTTTIGDTKIVATQSISRTDGSVAVGLTSYFPIKLGIVPNATLGLGGTSNGNGTNTANVNLSGSVPFGKTTYSSGANLSLTGQSGNNTNTQFGFSIFGQSSSAKDINTVRFQINF